MVGPNAAFCAAFVRPHAAGRGPRSYLLAITQLATDYYLNHEYDASLRVRPVPHAPARVPRDGHVALASHVKHAHRGAFAADKKLITHVV